MARRSKGLNFRKKKRELNIPLLREIAIWILEIAIAVALAGVCVYFVGVRTTVVGQSMNPTLEGGQQILVNRFCYKLTDPDPNDVIVFLPNGNEKSHYYVKRVIAGPGDTVQIKSGAIYVNGELFDDAVDAAAIKEAGIAEEEILVGEDEYFVLGDNRNNSEDSRYDNIGNVKKEYIVGKAWFIVSPFRDMGRVE